MMQEIEEKISAALRAVISIERPLGGILCQNNSGKLISAGSIQDELLPSHVVSLDELIESMLLHGVDWTELIYESHEASRSGPEGPWHHFFIDIRPTGEIDFTYVSEHDYATAIADTPNDDVASGTEPTAPPFDAKLASKESDFRIFCRLHNCGSECRVGAPISAALWELCAVIDWMCDVNNGSTQQYFARDRGWNMHGVPRAQLYDLTYRGLLRIGLTDMVAIFAESIALYAHFYERVEEARVRLAIPAVPKQTQSDIMGRYYELEPAINGAIARYVCTHVEELHQP